jgi:hypothetical protein
MEIKKVGILGGGNLRHDKLGQEAPRTPNDVH